MIEPTFPEAAEIPCEVERYLVGKHSPGTMKVVVTYTLPQSTDGQVGQNVTASIAESTLTIAQTR